MTTQPIWDQFKNWHELFDYLCVEGGFLDNADLASRLCLENGNTNQDAFNTAVKNLRNWRLGVHLPQRRNFLVLSRILQVDSFAGARQRWNELYVHARDMSPNHRNPGASEPQTRAPSKWRVSILAGIAIAAVLVLCTAAYHTLLATAGSDQDFEGIEADYRKSVTLMVGQALIIHGARGNNCGPAPSWSNAEPHLPELTTGKLSDGGVGTRYSRQCGGRVPARAILFTATNPGVEQTSLYGDPLTITVR